VTSTELRVFDVPSFILLRNRPTRWGVFVADSGLGGPASKSRLTVPTAAQWMLREQTYRGCHPIR